MNRVLNSSVQHVCFYEVKKDEQARNSKFFWCEHALIIGTLEYNFICRAVNPDQMAETLFKNCDTNKDGTLSFKEFAMTLYFLTKAPKEEKLKHIFLLLDTDGNGSLSSREVSSYLHHYSNLQFNEKNDPGQKMGY